MKFACACGNVIRDNTDCLPYAAHLVADQDIQDIYEAPGAGGLRHLLTRKMYQCSSCGRLFIEDQSKRHLKAFVPEEPVPHFLSSVYGPAWKRVLIGTWTDEPIAATLPRGFLNWDHLSEVDRATFDDWDLLEKAYIERFEDLKHQGILRSALLKKNGDTIHLWRYSTDRTGEGEPEAPPKGGQGASDSRAAPEGRRR